MNDFTTWINQLNSIFLTNDAFSGLKYDYIFFLYEDDLTPQEAFEEIMSYEVY